MINFASGGARFYRIQGGLLSYHNRFVTKPCLGLRTAYMQRPSHIGTVAREYNTEIADHEPLDRDRCRGGASMGQRRPYAPSDDGRKRHLFRPALSRPELKVASDLEF